MESHPHRLTSITAYRSLIDGPCTCCELIFQIQTDVVRKLQEERKDDKVHRNKETVISDKKEKKEKIEKLKTKDLIIITNEGIIIRIDINSISMMSRVTQGVRLINLRENQVVSSISVVDKEIEN